MLFEFKFVSLWFENWKVWKKKSTISRIWTLFQSYDSILLINNRNGNQAPDLDIWQFFSHLQYFDKSVFSESPYKRVFHDFICLVTFEVILFVCLFILKIVNEVTWISSKAIKKWMKAFFPFLHFKRKKDQGA